MQKWSITTSGLSCLAKLTSFKAMQQNTCFIQSVYLNLPDFGDEGRI